MGAPYSNVLHPVGIRNVSEMARPQSRNQSYGGEGGIRTLGEFPHTHLAGVRLQPLGHLSQKSTGGGRGTRTPMGFHPAVFKTAALPIRTSPPTFSSIRRDMALTTPSPNKRAANRSAVRHGTIWFCICQGDHPAFFGRASIACDRGHSNPGQCLAPPVFPTNSSPG